MGSPFGDPTIQPGAAFRPDAPLDAVTQIVHRLNL